MKIEVQTFKGQAPRVSERNLPAEMAQLALNAKLQRGDLEAWRQFVSEAVLPAFSPPAPVKTIYKLSNVWLQFKEQVDIARGVIPGDTSYFTVLTSPALYTEPRYTTLALATSGAAPYPFATRPLGMPAPTDAPTFVINASNTDPTVFSVDITDDGTVLATSWTVGPQVETDRYYTFTQGAGKYVMRYDENRDPGQEAWGYRNFGIAGATSVDVTAVFQFGGDAGHKQVCMTVGEALGAGVRLNVTDGVLYVHKAEQWGAQFYSATLTSVALGAMAAATDYCIRAQLTKNADGTKTVIATVYNGATPAAAVMGTVTVTNTFEDGDVVGFSAGVSDDAVTQYETSIDDIHVMASGLTGVTIVNTATAYVYTYVGANDWESAPSPASATLLRPDGASVTVTTPTTTPYSSEFGIVTKRLYRAVSGATGDAYYLLDEIPLAQADYLDELDDADITSPGTPLESLDWDLPHPDMEGVITLPNGIMAGFVNNQLCFSVIGHPHAWPIKWRLPTDKKIIAIKNLDNTIVIGTEGALYTATGNDPSSYSMSAPGEVQACVSKVSMTFVDGYGVVYASPDGFQVCAGSAGNVKNATELIYTKEQWEALVPSSISCVVYDGVLFFWMTGTDPDSGYALDTKTSGFGLISLSHHNTAAFVDPLTDSLYEVLDANSEPVEALLPVASSAVTPAATTIFKFDAHATDRIRQQWRGKLNLMPHPTTMHFARVEAEDFDNLVLRVIANGTLLYAVRVLSDEAFRIPGVRVFKSYELELVGTSQGYSAQLAQTVDELS